MNSLPLIPGYKIIDSLGRGGMAGVYLGVQEKLERQVAIKIMDPLLLRDEQFSIRFMKEARTAARLSHPNIITIHDVGTVRDDRGTDYHFIVMERLRESLSRRLKQCGSLQPGGALEVIKYIAGALAYAHDNGFIHRDIKPDNIMFRSDGSVVVVDFGIARAMGSVTQLTQTGTGIGTPHYMSPEQCRGEKVDGRSDFYSLGILFYEMLMGEVPYRAETTAGIIIKHLQEPIPALPPGLETFQPLLERLMAKDKERRVRDGKELIAAVDDLLAALGYRGTSPLPSYETEITGEGFSSRTVPTPVDNTIEEKKRWLLPVIMMGIIVILAASTAYLAIKGKSEDSRSPAKSDSSKILAPQKEDKKEDRKNNRELQKNNSLPKQEKEKKSNSFNDLPQEIQARYNETFQEIQLRLPDSRRAKRSRRGNHFLKVSGLLGLKVKVNENGKLTILEWRERLLVNAPKARPRILQFIRNRVISVSLEPPRDRGGKPFSFTLKLGYKVDTSENKIVLSRIEPERLKRPKRQEKR